MGSDIKKKTNNLRCNKIGLQLFQDGAEMYKTSIMKDIRENFNDWKYHLQYIVVAACQSKPYCCMNNG